jgi:adenylate cyclase
MTVGLLVGAVEVFYLSKKFKAHSFTKKILYKTFIYILFLFGIILVTFPIAASLELNTSILDGRVWGKLRVFLGSQAHLSTDLQLAVSLVASLFYFEISEHIGHGIMINLFSGKYHQPRQENRIFMFLDMKSSTTIAEKLGHTRYFELLKSYYNDLSDAIIQYEGEIYQYVGDEIIISWTMEKGIANTNCLRCFCAMKKDLEKRSSFYLKHFGVQPFFKAGLHCGEVTAGEIGALKKEIIFTGDTLNASARIQSLCNRYEVDILLSEDLVHALPTQFELKSLGKNELRGKEKSIELFTVV